MQASDELTYCRVLLLEDNASWRRSFETNLREVTTADVEVVWCRSVEEACNALQDAPPGDFDLLVFDLIVPKKHGDPVDPAADALNGMEAVEKATGEGYRDNMFLVSQVAGNNRAIRALKDRKIHVTEILTKGMDLGADGETWKQRFGPYLPDLRGILDQIEEEADLVIVDRSQAVALRRIYACLSKQRRGKEHWRGNPVHLLGVQDRGDQLRWARALAMIKRLLIDANVGDRSINDNPLHDFTSFDFAASKTSEAEMLVTIFGSCQRQGSTIEEGAVLLSSYPGAKLSDGNVESLVAWPTAPGVFTGIEITRCPSSVGQLLAQAMLQEHFPLPGQGRVSIKARCLFVFTSSQEIGKSLEDIAKVVGHNVIRVPGFQDPILAEQALWALCNPNLPHRSPYEGPSESWLHEQARSLLYEACQEGRISQAVLRRIADNYSPTKRITYNDVNSALPIYERDLEEVDPVPGLPTTLRPADFHQALSSWRVIRGGKRISLLKAVNDLNASPSQLLGLLIIMRACLNGKPFYASIGTAGPAEASDALRKLSHRHPETFRGSSKLGGVVVRDLAKWSEALKRHLPQVFHEANSPS